MASLVRCGCRRDWIVETADRVPDPADDFDLVLIGDTCLDASGEFLTDRRADAVAGHRGLWLALVGQRDPEYLASLWADGVRDGLTLPADDDRLAAWVTLVRRRNAHDTPPPADRAADSTTDEGLRQINRELRAICDGMPDGILVTESTQSHFVRANAAICRLTGYREEELLQLSLEELHPEEVRCEACSLFERLQEDPTVRACNLPVLRKDGTVIYCDLVANHVTCDGRRFTIGYFHDVTARREAELALARSQARFRAIFEAAALGVALVDLDARFIECNQTYSRLTGYKSEELVGKSVGDVTHPDDWPREQQRVQAFLQSENDVLQYEKRLRHRDGDVLWVSVSVSLLRAADGSPEMLLGVTEDITDRKYAEQALSESEETLRNLIENMPDVVFMLDRELMIQYVNRETPNFAIKDVIGTSILDLCDSEYHEVGTALVELAVETRKGQSLDVCSAFGQWVTCRLVPLVEDGEARNFMLICTDISQRREAEKAVREEQELLRRLLDLFERDRELVAFEIHDGFSQQLTGALLQFEAAAESLRASGCDAAASFDSGLRLLRESMAEARRLVRGLRPPVLDEYGIVPAIEHLIEDHLASGGAEVEFAASAATRRLARPLEGALFRIVQETLNNIRRHSRSGRARIELRQDHERVCLTVEDQGVGFEPEKVSTDHFGLRGIRERARLLGGRAEISSTPGQGTRVFVELPVVESVGMP